MVQSSNDQRNAEHARSDQSPGKAGIQIHEGIGGHRYLRCSHERIVRCKRELADGRVQVGEYCGDCGYNWRARAPVDPYEHERLPWYDTSLQDAWIEQQNELEQQQRAERDAEKAERNAEWWRRYNVYLQSDAWKRRRRLALERAQFRCEAMLQCDGARATQVHHTSYKHLGQEPLFELRAVCTSCHDAITKADRGEA